ncbi:hypothetical protein HDC94_001277 [Leifsonia sp. AK011]|uniref:hypothetical protein n=1 Tax=Leifsonia sp. AK011 TaxID=2723075 RepID=UPI0015CBABB2|nr:hypothetical protein [Leifsonia sp. AK011]NYF10121.1 hypothetical protein [Leifsonia sp. AK011]
MGFSLPGLPVALAILAPSFLLLPFPPIDAPSPAPRTSRIAGVLERVGQVGCLVLAVVVTPVLGHPGWLIALIALVALYYALWLRYLLGGRHFRLLYAPLGPIPVPLALTPVLAFLSASFWLQNWFLTGMAVVLGVGHITVSLQTARAART